MAKRKKLNLDLEIEELSKAIVSGNYTEEARCEPSAPIAPCHVVGCRASFLR